MKRILLYILLLLPCTLLHAQTVTNVDARQDGQNIVITFNMDKPSTPAIMYSTNGRNGPYNIIPEQFLQKTSVQGKSYEYKWNVLEQFEEFSFENVVFKIEQGTYFFSVSPTQKVQFSKGNIQYQISTKKWRFAKQQYELIGMGNTEHLSGNVGWIDLFHWLNVESISNVPNGDCRSCKWRILTQEEWTYVMKMRSGASSKFGVATVNNVNGIVLLPDEWVQPNGIVFNSGTGYFAQNNYSISTWKKLEENGAVFLPAAGYARGGDKYVGIGELGEAGFYWTGTIYEQNNLQASYFFFTSDSINMGIDSRYIRQSVRLVNDVN